MNLVELVKPGTDQEPDGDARKRFLAALLDSRRLVMGVVACCDMPRFLSPININDDDMDLAIEILRRGGR